MPGVLPLSRLVPLVAALWLAASSAQAAPEGDAVTRLLAEKGLLDAPQGSGLVQQVRDKASDMVLAAMNFLGVRYRRGGTSAEEGFDCSGFTRHIFERSLGLVLPRRADEQAAAPGLIGVKRDDLKPGDLVFFNTLKRTFSHVGIYIGDNKFIHSPRAGGEVRIEDMRLAYWTKRFTGARRAGPLTSTVASPSQSTSPGPSPIAAFTAANATAPSEPSSPAPAEPALRAPPDDVERFRTRF